MAPTAPDRQLLTAEDEGRLATAIEAGVLAAAARARPRGGAPAALGEVALAATDTELAQVELAGRAAWQRFVEANLGLVRHLAAREARRCQMSEGELFQEGCVALMVALQRFDHRRGVRFSTYAVPWIRAAIGLASARRCGAVDLPPWRAEVLRRVRAAQNTLAVGLGRMPSAAEVGASFDRDADWVNGVLAHRAAQSIDDPDGYLTQLPDQVGEHGFDRVLGQDAGAGLLDRLPPLERQVLGLRFGFTDGRAYSLRETAARLGIGRRRLTSIESRALDRLRGWLAESVA